MIKDYYTILGVSPEASEEEIQSAFERLSLRFDQKYSEGTWAEIEEAYLVLSDPKARVDYHRLYQMTGKTGRSFDGLDYSRSHSSYTVKGLPLVSPTKHANGSLPLLDNLVEALKDSIFDLIGQEKEERLDKKIIRPHIHLDLRLDPNKVGKNFYQFLDYHCYIPCSDCQGSGYRYQNNPLAESNCPKCQGEGRVMARRQVEVKIPKNIANKATIHIKGAGHYGRRGAERGDLFIKVLFKKA